MKKLFITATLTLALCGVANAGGTAEDIKKVVDAQELKNEQYQNFIWDQELINKSQAESNKQCSDFITSQKIDPIENIQMEMTGSNSLRNVGWTPTKLIVLSRDSINISYKDGKRYWLVNSINKN